MERHVNKSAAYSLLLILAYICCCQQLLAADADTVLVFKTQGAVFQEVYSGIKEDLGEDIHFVDITVTKKTAPSLIAGNINSQAPKLIILIGNIAVKHYTKYQKNNNAKTFPPSFIIAALYADRLVKKVKNSTGILYEIPAVISMVNLRSLIKKPVRRVGVLHRKWMKKFIQSNQAFCKNENIELINIVLPNKDRNMAKLVKNGINDIASRIDALWVLNDNALLNSKVLSKGWLPALKRFNKPIVVGVEPLLASRLNFGSFAIVPDHYALGVQGAGVIAEIMDNDWSIEDISLEQPVSIKKILNMTISQNRHILIHDSKLDEVDKVIK